MSIAFREYVKKIGSGRLTGRDLSREEACRATLMLLHQEATPAQIGAFLIAHRIKRPTPEELAGILDAFDAAARPLQLPAHGRPPLVLTSPYDGQERLGNVTPLTALVVSALGQPVVLHGSTQMPPKHGLTSFDILAALGIDPGRDAASLAEQYAATGLGWVYLPVHFPEAFALQALRDEIGKRPPLATAELFWNPVRVGLPVIGYTHRETINLAVATATLRELEAFVMVRGLQGSVNCTLFHPNLGLRWARHLEAPEPFRLLAADWGLADDDYEQVGDGRDALRHAELIRATLEGQPTPFRRAALFNSAFLLLQAQFVASLDEGLALAGKALDEGLAHRQLEQLRR